MDDRRSEYRIQFGGGLTAQEIRLHVPGLAPLEGRLIDVSGHGASVVVRRAGVSVRNLRALLDLEFTGGLFPSPVRVGAKILYANEEAHYLRCGLAFVAPDNLRSLLPKNLLAMFNRRAEMRLQFGSDSPAEVYLERPGQESAVHGSLFDLSPSGLCVLLDERDARELRAEEPASAYFTLPGQWRQLVFRVTPRNFRPHEGRVLVGMEFGLRESKAYEKRREIVEDYLARFLIEAAA